MVRKAWMDGAWLHSLVMELADLPGHPARAVARRHKAEIERWYAEVFAKAKSLNRLRNARDKSRCSSRARQY